MQPHTRVALALLLLAGCSSGRVASIEPAVVPADPSPWKPIALPAVRRDDFRHAIDALLRVTGSELWPGFTLDDHGIILIDARQQTAEIVCIGLCVIEPKRSSRLWRLTRRMRAPADLVGAPGREWSLPQQDVVVAPFDGTDLVAFVVLHEDFHLTFQGRYGVAHTDAFEPPNERPSGYTRATLEKAYVADEQTLRGVRDECAALSSALRAGDESAMRVALRRFVILRDARRAKPNAPSFEEDYWEQVEGIAANVERRAAAVLGVRDPSVIQSALDDGCDIVGPVPYFIVLGGLEAALLDRNARSSWPAAVYPERGRSTPLFSLIRKYAAPAERN